MWTPKRILIFLTALFGFLAVFGVVVTVFGWVDGLPNLPPHYFHNPNDSKQVEEPGSGLGPVNVRDFKIRQAFGIGEEKDRLSKVYLASKGAVLAIDKYVIEKDGRVKMWPFSLGLFAKTSKPDQRFPEITTVQCDEAYVRLDRPITSLTELSRSKVVAVELVGDTIKIKNNRGTQELNDDLEMRVMGIDKQEARLFYEDARNLVWSHGVVELLDTQSQPQPTKITAIGLLVDLSKDASPNRDKKAAPAKKNEEGNGVEKITLLSNVDMHLFVDARSGFMAGPDELAKKQTAKADPKDKDHVHIKTNGKFVYDLIKKTARFDAPEQTALIRDRVVVTRHQNAAGPKGNVPTDFLDCDRLDLEFREKAAGEPSSNDKEIKSAIATAKPGADVELHLESEEMKAFGDEMRYFAPTPATGPRTIILGKPMHAVRQGSKIECEELHMTGEDKLGKGQEAFAKGPGKIDLLDKQTGRLTTHILFRKSFAVSDDRDGDRVYKLLTLRGDAAYIDEERKQELHAAQFLHVWLDEVKAEPAKAPPANAGNAAKKDDPPASNRHKPHKIEGFEKVWLRSPQLNILDTNRLTVYFRDQQIALVDNAAPQEKAVNGVAAIPAIGPSRGEATPVALPKNPNDQGPNVFLLPPNAKSGPIPKADDEKPKKPIEMTASEINAHVATVGNTNELLEFVADGAVHVTQAAENPKDKGLDIIGRMLHLVRKPRGDILEVFGDPRGGPLKVARLHFNDMFLAGPTVTIDQVNNIANVKGTGSMQMPSSTTLDGKKKDGDVRIDWNESMWFNGRFAKFGGGVQAFQGNGTMQGQEMEVTLDKPVYFKQTKDNQTAKVDKIQCIRDKVNPVVILEEERQKNNKILTYRQLVLSSVTVDNTDQHLSGSGPGVLDFIGLSSANDAGIGPAPNPPANSPKKKNDDGILKWTRIHFQGNVTSWLTVGGGRKTTFTDNVRVFHQPGDDPKIPDPDALNIVKDGLWLNCQRLTVNQRKVGDKTSQEMIAEGGIGLVSFRTQQFHGVAKTVKYNESQDVIVFLNNVTIYQIPKVRGAQTEEIRGKLVHYDRKTGKLNYETKSINWSW